MAGNAQLRSELDTATKLRFRHQYTEALERLRREFAHSISILPDGRDRIERFNCFAYALGLWEHPEYIRRVDAASNSAVANSLVVRALLEGGKLIETSAAAAVPGDVVLYFDKKAITHAALISEQQTYCSKWGGDDVHQHRLWEVPAQYGNRVRYYRVPDASSILACLPDPK
jgi:hypothetical protein